MKRRIGVLAIALCLGVGCVCVWNSRRSGPNANASTSTFEATNKIPVPRPETNEARKDKPDTSTPQKSWSTLLEAIRSKNLDILRACCTPEESLRLSRLTPEAWKEEQRSFEYYAKAIIWPDVASEANVSAIVINKAPATYMDFKKVGDAWLCAGTSAHGANQ
jgi:hypothetical protein